MNRTGCMVAALWLVAASAFAQAQDAASAPAPKVLLLPAHSEGVDPRAARFVDRGLHNAAEQQGYELVEDDAPTAVPAGTAGTALTMVELWDRVHRAGADYAVLAILSARSGRYALELRVACRDGRGPFFAYGDANNAELEAEAGRLLGIAIAGGTRGPDQGQDQGPNPVPNPNPASSPGPNPSTSTRADSPPVLQHRVRLALHDELVVGMGRDHFAGALLGARADYRMGRALYLGAYLGYANLPGRDGRAHSILWYAQLEDRIQISDRFGVPLRLGLGYLARNGSVLRLSSGFAVRLAGRLELVADVLAPTFWVTPDTTLLSLDLGLELALSL